jgi:hypothetical protein
MMKSQSFYIRTLTVLLGSILVGGFVIQPQNTPAYSGLFLNPDGTMIETNTSHVVVAHDGFQNVLTYSGSVINPSRKFVALVPFRGQVEQPDVSTVRWDYVYELFERTAPLILRDKETRATRKGAGVMGAGGLESSRMMVPYTFEAPIGMAEHTIPDLTLDDMENPIGWLESNGYKVEGAAKDILEEYIDLGCKFAIAEVNFRDAEVHVPRILPPIQVRYESSQIDLPFRLGTASTDKPIDTTLYIFTRNGEVHAPNFKTIQMESEHELPEFILRELNQFITAQRQHRFETNEKKGVFVEFQDKVAADKEITSHLMLKYTNIRESFEPELFKNLGVSWAEESSKTGRAWLTRLQVRHDADSHDDLVLFEEVENSMGSTFDVSYEAKDWWGMKSEDPTAIKYRNEYRQKMMMQAGNLELITGWELTDILDEKFPGEQSEREKKAVEEKKELEEYMAERAAKAQEMAAQQPLIPTQWLLVAGGGFIICILWLLISGSKGSGPKGGSSSGSGFTSSSPAHSDTGETTGEFDYKQ